MAEAHKPAIVIHGGAGTILRERLTGEVESAYRSALEEAANAGYAILSGGGGSHDAVVAAVSVMEDSPLFNAGHGAVLTHEGRVEMDAAVMDGRDLAAGAIAGVKHIGNPVSLASAVLRRSPHVMLIGEGAEQFAVEQGFTLVDNREFVTERRQRQLEQVLAEDAGRSVLSEDDDDLDMALRDKQHSTVGAVAMDSSGNISAATSTGGMTNKRYGRVGDSPIFGAGTYADNATGGISATGHGEFFIRAVVAHDICARAAYKEISLQKAADEVVQTRLVQLGGDGGVIGIDAAGEIVISFNSAGMYHAWIDREGNQGTGIFK